MGKITVKYIPQGEKITVRVKKAVTKATIDDLSDWLFQEEMKRIDLLDWTEDHEK